jgi:HEAT repeat protein
MPVVPSEDALTEVKPYGDKAVRVLATYLESRDALVQHVALRFLFEFHSDSALNAIQGFAENSRIPGIRQEAVGALLEFPTEKVKLAVERISNTDTNPEVRAYARRTFGRFPPTDPEK